MTTDKVIITVTVDSTASYPRNPNMPPIDEVGLVADEYVRAIDAGAAIVHHHGVHRLEEELQPDGRRLSRTDYDGWAALTEGIRTRRDAIVQFGIASARLDEKIRLLRLRPEMMSYAFNPHDEFFQPDPDYPAIEQYSIHPRDELEAFCIAAREHGVRPEVEAFTSGAFFNLDYIRSKGLLDDPVWATIFLGWRGGTWTPPTPDALLYMVRHLPARVNWNLSVMNPQQQWRLLAVALGMGGHVRVGWEDNPYLPDGTLSTSNAELVDTIVRLARLLGREPATPDEARQIIGIPSRPSASEAPTQSEVA